VKHDPECLDTNVLLRYILGDVPHQQERAIALLKSGGRFRVLDPVWVETVYALERHYAFSRDAVRETVSSLAALDEIVGDAEALAKVCDTYISHPKLSFVDCLIAARTEQIGATPLYTFDAKLAKQHPAAKMVP
jgi:predicted nucleic-acid-binding protein